MERWGNRQSQAQSHELCPNSGRYISQDFRTRVDKMKDHHPNTHLNSSQQTTIPELASDLRADPRMAPVIEVFLTEFPLLMERISAIANQQNLQDLKSSAHRLKGAAGSAGFSRIYDLAGHVEECAVNHHLETALPSIDELNRICQASMQNHPPSKTR